MIISVLGSGVVHESADVHAKIKSLQTLASFRKASLNMMLAHLALEEAQSDAGVILRDRSNIAFVLGSSYGELENTVGFLKVLTLEGIARPFLFQSSLHNGTLGFLTQERGLSGPSFTVSHKYLTGEKALELASDLIRNKTASLAIVCAVDVMSHELMAQNLSLVPKGMQWRNGAAALILASEDYLASHQRRAKAKLGSIKYLPKKGASVTPLRSVFYDSDGLEQVASGIRSGIEGMQCLDLLKVDGTISQVELSESQ